MTPEGICGYGRYNDDPEHVGCPRAKTSETPCIARDGSTALADDHKCVGCDKSPSRLLKELRLSGAIQYPDPTGWVQQADKLRDVVREVTAVVLTADVKPTERRRGR